MCVCVCVSGMGMRGAHVHDLETHKLLHRVRVYTAWAVGSGSGAAGASARVWAAGGCFFCDRFGAGQPHSLLPPPRTDGHPSPAQRAFIIRRTSLITSRPATNHHRQLEGPHDGAASCIDAPAATHSLPPRMYITFDPRHPPSPPNRARSWRGPTTAPSRASTRRSTAACSSAAAPTAWCAAQPAPPRGRLAPCGAARRWEALALARAACRLVDGHVIARAHVIDCIVSHIIRRRARRSLATTSGCAATRRL